MPKRLKFSTIFATIALGISLILPVNIINAYPLSPESKKFIAIMAALGGTAGGLIGYLASDKPYYYDYQKPTTLWGKIKSFSWSSVLIPAGFGAAAAAGISYFCTYEKILERAVTGLENTELKLVVESSDLAEVKNLSFREKYSTAAAYDRLNRVYDSLISLKDSLIKVTKSGIPLLVSVAHACLDRLANYEAKVREWLIAMKNDPKLLQETMQKATIETQRQMAYAQQQQAYAQHQLATAALVNAFKPNQVVVVQNK